MYKGKRYFEMGSIWRFKSHTILGKRLTWQGQPRTYKKRVKMPAAIQSDQFMGKNSSCKAPAAK